MPGFLTEMGPLGPSMVSIERWKIEWCKNGCVMTQESATQWSHAPQTCHPHPQYILMHIHSLV